MTPHAEVVFVDVETGERKYDDKIHAPDPEQSFESFAKYAHAIMGEPVGSWYVTVTYHSDEHYGRGELLLYCTRTIEVVDVSGTRE